MLQEQTNLHEAHILELTHSHKLMMVQVYEHCGVLYYLDTRLNL